MAVKVLKAAIRKNRIADIENSFIFAVQRVGWSISIALL